VSGSDPSTVLAVGWGYHGALEPLGAGRINDTWRSTADRVVLQRINPRVFDRPLDVMANVERVVEHLTAVAPGWVPELLRARDGTAWVGSQGDVYRLWRFVDGAPCFDDSILLDAAFAFGRTQRLLADLPGPRLADTIEGFLRLPRFLGRLDQLAGSGTARDVRQLIDAVGPHRVLAESFGEPTGYIHGDCKLGNLLFDPAGRVAAVLDLDTVMWGHWAWDFGDLARSGSSREGRFEIERFDALTRGLLAGARPPADPAALADAPAYVALILATRYLIDHLEGDVHFKVERRGGNLTRASGQLAMLASMRTARSRMLETAERALEARHPRSD
jgi:Ser/Thr protein kinase RdoA (MazF antagonist)